MTLGIFENDGRRPFLLDYNAMSVTVLFLPTEQLVDNKGDLHSHLYEMN